MPLKGKTMVVTGGSRGVGRAVVMELAKRHANVVFTFRKDEESAERLIKAAVAMGGSATGHRVNVCDGAEVKAFIKSVVRDYQRIDGLVNNAGIRMDRTLLYMEEREWEEVLGVNLTGVFHVTKADYPPHAEGAQRQNRQHRVGQRDTRLVRADKLFRCQGGAAWLHKGFGEGNGLLWDCR